MQKANNRLMRFITYSFYKFLRNEKAEPLKKIVRKYPLEITSYFVVYLLATIMASVVLLSFFVGIKDASEILRNFLLGLGALAAFPFLVWRSINNDKDTRLSHESHQQEIYIKAVEQLASDKESIRLGAVLTLKELVVNSNNKELIQKTIDMLYYFMEEHSRDVLPEIYNILSNNIHKDEYAMEIQESFDNITTPIKPYYSQFHEIIHLFALTDKKITECNIPYSMKNICLARVAWKNSKNLIKANLHEAHLTGANLSRSDLSDAYLREGYLRFALLGEANFSGTNLSEADLRDTYLEWTNFTGASLSGANLSNAHLHGAGLTGANLSNTYLEGAVLQGAYFNSEPISDEDGHIIEPTVLPDDFSYEDAIAAGMIDVSRQEEEIDDDSLDNSDEYVDEDMEDDLSSV